MKIEINVDAPRIEKDSSWQKCVGSGHAFLAHRVDWCEYVKRVHEELGIRYVRFHGILDDDMLTVQRLSDFMPLPNAGKVREYSFRQVGKIYDNVLSTGMKPFVELSFMPSALASGKKTGLHYRNNITPPKDYTQWADYVKAFITFLIDRYGREEVESWYFEVWNEPDLGTFFSGKQEEYFKLYLNTVKAIKEVNKNISVGGPSTSGGRWLDEFLAFVEKNNLPCDFVSTHQYPGDGFGNEFHMSDVFAKFPKIIKKSVKENRDIAETITSFFFDPDSFKKVPKGVLRDAVKKAREKVGKRKLFYTEWNCTSVFGAPVNDEKYSAAFAAKTILDLNQKADCFAIWCCNDLFEEILYINKPFHGGFGLMTNLGIPKPVFWALKLMAETYPMRLELPAWTNGEVEYAAFTDEKNLQIFIYAQTADYMAHEKFEINLQLNRTAGKVEAVRIDDAHCNPKRIWQEMGAPMDPTPAQVEQIKVQSKPVREAVPFENGEDSCSMNLTLSSNDIIVLYVNGGKGKNEKTGI